MSLISYKYYDEVIGLGRHCQLAWYLRKRRLSEKRHIFDNMVSNNLNSVCNLIENEFNGFFDYSNIKKLEFNDWNSFTVKDESTGITSFHDFSRDLDKESHQLFIEEKKIYINNLFDSIKHKDSLLFIRVNNYFEPLEQTIRLLEILRSLRKDKKFDLYVFQECDFVEKVIGIPNIFMFYDKKWDWNPEMQWHGSIKMWDAIFNHVRIKFN